MERGLTILLIEIDGLLYDAVLKNQIYDQKKYQGHRDIVQIRYSPGSAIANKLREKFSYTMDLIRRQKEVTGSTRVDNWDEKDKEYIAVYSTDQPDILSFDCICNTEFREEAEAISDLGKRAGEMVAESVL